MFTILKKLCITFFTFFILSTSTFACMNDVYTANSETLWGQSYQKNTFVINIITTIIILLILFFIFLKTYKIHEKNFTENEIPFTLFIFLSAAFFMSGRIFIGNYTLIAFAGIFGFIFFIGFIKVFLYHFSLLVRKNIQSRDNKSMILIVLLLPYVLSMCYFASPSHGFGRFDAIIMVLLTNFMLLYSMYVIKCYNYRIYTIAIFSIFLIYSLPVYLKISNNVQTITKIRSLDNMRSESTNKVNLR